LRLKLAQQWYELPDFVSVNFHEEGASTLASALLERGVGIEAGVWNSESTLMFARWELSGRCLRLLIEPKETSVDDAEANVKEIEKSLSSFNLEIPRLLHGENETVWAMIRAASIRQYDTRIGLEDTLMLSNGSIAANNGELVKAAIQIYGDI